MRILFSFFKARTKRWVKMKIERPFEHRNYDISRLKGGPGACVCVIGTHQIVCRQSNDWPSMREMKNHAERLRFSGLSSFLSSFPRKFNFFRSMLFPFYGFLIKCVLCHGNVCEMDRRVPRELDEDGTWQFLAFRLFGPCHGKRWRRKKKKFGARKVFHAVEFTIQRRTKSRSIFISLSFSILKLPNEKKNLFPTIQIRLSAVRA